MKKQKITLTLIWILILVSLFFCNFTKTYAKNDCELLKIDSLSTENPYFDKISQIYPKQDIQVAIDHLVYFCCENWYAKNSKYCPKQDEKWKFLTQKLYAQSPYLYDQILDIGMRRLDGDANTQYQEAWLDIFWAKRRKWIRNASMLTNGIAPISVTKKYKEFRKPWIKDDDAFPSSDIDTISQKWSKYWLKNRYFAMCYVADYVEAVINPKISYNSDIKLQKQTKKCFWLVQEIIEQEFYYMKRVMIQQWAKLVSHNMNTYTDDYFTRWRLQPVLEKIAKMQATFLMINQKVNEWTNQCTKK